MPGHQQFYRVLPVCARLGAGLYGDLQSATGHAQSLHGVCDGLCQLTCCLLAQMRDAISLLLIVLLGGLAGLFQSGQVLLLLQCLPALLAVLPKIDQLLGLLVQAPRQSQPVGQALFQRVEARRIQIRAGQKALQIAGHFLDLDVGAVERIGPFAVFGGDVALRLQGRVSLVQAVQNAAVLVFQQQAAAFCGIQQFFGVGQAAVFFVQGFPFASGRVQAASSAASTCCGASWPFQRRSLALRY